MNKLVVYFSFFVCLFTFVSAQLEINPNNPHYLIYKGKPIFLITDASNLDQSSGRGSPYNHKTIIDITATGRPNMLYNNEDLNSGWNDAVWADLRNDVRAARDKGNIIGIMFWSTPMLEQGNGGRWGTHLWNAENGGPISNDGDGKSEFYTLADYNSEISGSYGSLSSWQERNQFRQEELVKKYLSELSEFDNVYYIPMYEMGDDSGISHSKIHDWHRHIAKVITDRQPGRLVGSVISTGDEEWIAAWNEVDVLLFEGPYAPSSSSLKSHYWSYNKPLIWEFIYPGVSNPVGDMRDAVVNGLQPADEIRGQSSAQDSFARRLSDFIDTVETWCDEPGQEITSSTVPGVSGGSGTDLPAGSCTDTGTNNGGDPCSASCASWSDLVNACGSRSCTRTDCSNYVETKSCNRNPPSTEIPVVSNLNPSSYQLGTLSVGEQYYVDRNYVLESVPSEYAGSLLIRTANDDKNSGVGVSFNVDRDVNVYVAFDPRVAPSSWLSSSFVKTGGKIFVSDHSLDSLDVWRSEFSAGSVNLGANGVGSVEGSMYFIFLEGVEDPTTSGEVGCGLGVGPDVNNDGNKDILDIVCLAMNIGKDKPKLDLNSDGVINVLDLIIIARSLNNIGSN